MKSILIVVASVLLALTSVYAQNGCNKEVTSEKNKCDGVPCAADEVCNSGFCLGLVVSEKTTLGACFTKRGADE